MCVCVFERGGGGGEREGMRERVSVRARGGAEGQVRREGGKEVVEEKEGKGWGRGGTGRGVIVLHLRHVHAYAWTHSHGDTA